MQKEEGMNVLVTFYCVIKFKKDGKVVEYANGTCGSKQEFDEWYASQKTLEQNLYYKTRNHTEMLIMKNNLLTRNHKENFIMQMKGHMLMIQRMIPLTTLR